MFSLIFVYLFCALALWWCYSGYIYYLILYNLFRRLHAREEKIDSYPHIKVIIPVFNENEIIESKLKNSLDLDYPVDKLDIIVVDAASTDGTSDTVSKFQKDHPDADVTLLHSPIQGRSHQINHVLKEVAQPDLWILSDADAFLEKDVIKWIVAEFQRDAKIGVVGAFVEPQNTIPLEVKYWQYQNIMRWLESNIHSASIVVGPCFAFRPQVITRVPDDCSADDVYSSFAANAKGYQSKYIINAKVVETRTPTTTLTYLNHKFRKGNGYNVELLRFVYLFPTYCFKWKIVFMTKVLQIIIMPFITLFFLFISVNISFVSMGYLYAVLTGWLFLLVNVLVTSVALKFYYKAICKKDVKGGMIRSFIYSNFILFCSVLSYLFHFQDSRPEKIDDSK